MFSDRQRDHPRPDRVARPAIAWLMVLVPALLSAQEIVDQGERLDSDRPEAWAMAYMSASTLFSGFGPAAGREPWSFSLGAEAGHIPHLSTAKRRVGLNGTKLEDLNKSPVFGRLRGELALPEEFSLELSWTPPIEVDGARARDLFGVALQRPLYRDPDWRLGARVFHQRGTIGGDITCDRDTASHEPGSAENPFGCREPSDDRFKIHQTGLEISVSREFRDPRVAPYLTYTATRMKPQTRVRARTFSVLDRSVLTSRMTTHTVTAGAVFRPLDGWEAVVALAWTPLDSRRPPDDRTSRHDLYSTRLMLRRWLR